MKTNFSAMPPMALTARTSLLSRSFSRIVISFCDKVSRRGCRSRKPLCHKSLGSPLRQPAMIFPIYCLRACVAGTMVYPLPEKHILNIRDSVVSPVVNGSQTLYSSGCIRCDDSYIHPLLAIDGDPLFHLGSFPPANACHQGS